MSHGLVVESTAREDIIIAPFKTHAGAVRWARRHLDKARVPVRWWVGTYIEPAAAAEQLKAAR